MIPVKISVLWGGCNLADDIPDPIMTIPKHAQVEQGTAD